MNPKLRVKEENNRISRKIESGAKCFSEQYPWISFKSMTKNSSHTLYALPNGKEGESTLRKLLQRLEEISSHPWIYWMQQPKKTGLETLKYDEILFEASPNANLAKDTTIYVFRFDTHTGSGNGRIMGYKQTPCSAFHIIGYDFDFSAYKH